MVLRGTQQFFGISDHNNTNDDIWRQRGRRLLSKHGRIKQSVGQTIPFSQNNLFLILIQLKVSQTRGATDVTGFDEIDGNLHNNRMTGFTDNRGTISSDTNPEDLSRRPALKVTFKAIALASNVLIFVFNSKYINN